MYENYEYGTTSEVNIHSPDNEIDKSKTINQMTFDELIKMKSRLALELDIESQIISLNRNRQNGEGIYNGNIKVDASTPISELYHHGITGQKWGERRYQNEDGSLTEEGRKRYGYGEPKNSVAEAFRSLTSSGRQINADLAKGRTEAAKKKAAQDRAAKAREAKAEKPKLTPEQKAKLEREWMLKNVRNMSDEKLQKSLERLRSEKQLKDLINDDVRPGRTKAVSILKSIGETTLKKVGNEAAVYGIRALAQRSWDWKEFADLLGPNKGQQQAPQQKAQQAPQQKAQQAPQQKAQQAPQQKAQQAPQQKAQQAPQQKNQHPKKK